MLTEMLLNPPTPSSLPCTMLLCFEMSEIQCDYLIVVIEWVTYCSTVVICIDIFITDKMFGDFNPFIFPVLNAEILKF